MTRKSELSKRIILSMMNEFKQKPRDFLPDDIVMCQSGSKVIYFSHYQSWGQLKLTIVGNLFDNNSPICLGVATLVYFCTILAPLVNVWTGDCTFTLSKSDELTKAPKIK